MDRKSPAIPEIQRLIHLGAAARSCLMGEVGALRQRLDVPARIRGSVHDHPATWMFGSLAAGLAASCLFRRKNPSPNSPTPQKSRGIPVKLLAMAWTASRPLVKLWLAEQAKNWLAGQPLPSPASRLLARLSPTSKSL